MSSEKLKKNISRKWVISCLTLLPLIVGCYIMGYEPEPLPSYNKLRNRSYHIMLNYTDSPSTLHIHAPRPDPTISPSGSSPASTLPQYIVHKWGCILPVTRWSPAVSECTPVWGVRLLLLVPPPPGDITTPRPPHVSSSSPWSIWPPYDGTPPGPSTLPLSPPNFNCCTAALSIPQAHTVAPVFVNILKITPHCLRAWNES